MRYCVARIGQHNEDKAFRFYVADTFKMLAENTARYAGGAWPQKRFADLLDHSPPDRRTGDQIAADVIAHAGLVVIAE